MTKHVSFRIVPHSYEQGVEVVEILLDGQMCACIYPDQHKEQTVKFVSAHFVGELTHNNDFPEGVKMDTGDKIYPPIPAITISLDPRPYRIGHGTIVRV